MNTRHGDDGLENLLRESLAAHAESVQPAGDGLSRIQHRIAVRRQRARWLRPALAVGVVAALAAGGVGGFVALSGPSGTESVEVPPARHSSSHPTPTPSHSVQTVVPAFPSTGVFPFVTGAQELAWEAGGGKTGPQAWAASPTRCALRFVADMLGHPSVSKVTGSDVAPDGRTATVTLGRTLQAESHGTVDVTKVRLVRYRTAWVVVGSADSGGLLRVSSPNAGVAVTSPLTVTGPGFGTDEAVTVEMRSAHASGAVGRPAHASFGRGTPTWSARLQFPTPHDPAGAVVVTDVSAADGGPARIVVVPVRFGQRSTTTYPARFVAVKNGRVTLFTSRNGAALKYLTPASAAGTPSDPQVEGGHVYYLSTAAHCSTTVLRVPMTGGQPSQTAAADAGYKIVNFAVSSDGSKVALFESSCGRATPQGRLVARDLTSGRRHVVETYQSFPPMVMGDPSWEPDGEHLDVFTRSGMMGGFARYDGFVSTPPKPVCGDRGPMPYAPLEVDGSGALWYADYTGSVTEVFRCVDNHSARMFTLHGAVADIDVSADGSAVLLTDDSGHLWRWSDHRTVRLTPSVPIKHASWE